MSGHKQKVSAHHKLFHNTGAIQKILWKNYRPASKCCFDFDRAVNHVKYKPSNKIKQLHVKTFKCLKVKTRSVYHKISEWVKIKDNKCS